MEARPDFKKMSTEKKLEYVWDYYRFHIAGILILAIVIISTVYHFTTLKESVMDVVFVNGYCPYEEPLGLDEFFTSQGFNADTQEINIITSLNFTLTEDDYYAEPHSFQTLIGMFTLGEMDVFAAPRQIYSQLATSDYIADLRSVFSEEELSAYEDILIYAVNDNTGEEFPCGFNVSTNRWLLENAYYLEENCYIGIPSTFNDPQISKEFLLYILNY